MGDHIFKALLLLMWFDDNNPRIERMSMKEHRTTNLYVWWFALYNICNKLCRLDYVQLEDDIGYIKSSKTDLLSSNWT